MRLLEAPHRTYLWVYLVFDYLKSSRFKRTIKGIESTITTLPKSVNQAYEKVLDKAQEQSTVRKVLSIIMAASRPLTLTEMNIAVNTDRSMRSNHLKKISTLKKKRILNRALDLGVDCSYPFTTTKFTFCIKLLENFSSQTRYYLPRRSYAGSTQSPAVMHTGFLRRSVLSILTS